ncbi:hypothetical protein FDN13_12735 [Caloramator sp. E03]|uniref:nitroreductase family protein n=1 Tax=Caloramator sp. E03 TaxID=2576307 RepID=UPI0011106C84|nr:nitroreductase family protein [Caloramator sp. E03]QCX34498.1 hypothetical protein FDN13_12735 [Caloramator sp. E03]
MTTVSGLNIKEVPDIIDIVVKHGVDVYAFARYCPNGKEKDIGMTPQEYKELLDICYQKFQKYEKEGCKTYFNRKDHLWTLYEYEKGIFKIPVDVQTGMIYGGCNCGNCHLTILPNGDIYACRRFESKVSNAFKNGFYGAPTVCIVFSQKNFLFSIADSFCCATNMVLEATELGISSCIISRAEETFENELGQKLLKDWQISDNYIARCFVILGYCDGEYPTDKPRKNGRIKIVE